MITTWLNRGDVIRLGSGAEWVITLPGLWEFSGVVVYRVADHPVIELQPRAAVKVF